MSAFANRNVKEMIRDPLTIIFGIGFPVILLLLLSAIQSNIPVEIFQIAKLSPGIAVFGLSFISLFSGLLIAKDRSTSYLLRLFASPLKSADYILGYALPMLPIAIIQCLVCYITAMFLGLHFTANIFISILILIPAMILFIGIGLLCGCVFNDKQVGGVCGALLTNLSAWLSGTWFDLELVGGAFKKIAYCLPFVHAVNAARGGLSGNYDTVFSDLLWVSVYAIVIMVAAIFLFNKKIHSGKI